RGTGDPSFSSPFGHGTEMLSMIAGPIYGAARGTPINVISYDIYPDGLTAKLSSLIEAIGLANSDKALNYPFDPAVYCIASSSTTPGNSPQNLKAAIDYAIGSSVNATVLVSAGNDGVIGSPLAYSPSDQGAKSGVICVGAIDIANERLPSTRGPLGVDLWAPGDMVSAADVDGRATTVSGTSPATALAAGAALIYLSANPVLIPEDLETAMVTTHSQSAPIGEIVHVDTEAPGIMTFADWASWYGWSSDSTSENIDGDNWTNEEEYIWGFDPTVKNFEGSVVTLSYDPLTTTLTFEFHLSCFLYQPSTLMSPHELRDGSSLIIEQSSDLQSWTNIEDLILVEEGPSGGQMRVSFTRMVSSSRCFFRVSVQ
ncbi:MAG: S8/S53 family peptidase, partial [Roseibacillus sp.]